MNKNIEPFSESLKKRFNRKNSSYPRQARYIDKLNNVKSREKMLNSEVQEAKLTITHGFFYEIQDVSNLEKELDKQVQNELREAYQDFDI